MTKKRRAVCLALIICLLIVMVSFILTGCETYGNKIAADSEHTEELEVWALIKIGGGEPLHVKVNKWNLIGTGGIVRIYTEDQVYVTHSTNVLFVADLN